MARSTTSTDASELFGQAIRTFEAALKSGVSIQQECAKQFTNMLGDFSSPQEWPKKSQAVISEAIPATQKNVDEAIQAMKQNCKSSLELLQRAFEASQCTSMSEAQLKTRESWEASLSALRTNTQAVVQANSRLMESWADLAKAWSRPASTQTEQEAQPPQQEAQHHEGGNP